MVRVQSTFSKTALHLQMDTTRRKAVKAVVPSLRKGNGSLFSKNIKKYAIVHPLPGMHGHGGGTGSHLACI
jgi:hypothetical protein